MELQDPYKILKIEFSGIKNVITKYSSSGLIGNYINKLETALNLDSADDVLYSLDHICIWYDENMNKIMSNKLVCNKAEHKKTKEMLNTLNSQLKEYDFSNLCKAKDENKKINRKIFIVHGRDEVTKNVVARLLEHLDIEPIILHEQPDDGNTIIEKLETYTSQVSYAIVLYTECDIARAKEESEEENKFRARQNVVFEHGLLIGILGRKNVCALVKGNVEIPSDINGIVYVNMDATDNWKIQLCKNIKNAGIDIDLNKLF